MPNLRPLVKGYQWCDQPRQVLKSRVSGSLFDESPTSVSALRDLDVTFAKFPPATTHWPRSCRHIAAVGIGEERKGWLRTAKGWKASVLAQQPMSQADAWHLIRQCAKAAGVRRPSAAIPSVPPESRPIWRMAGRLSTPRPGARA
jgi:hypothetical protein